jgi:hypothetical protein
MDWQPISTAPKDETWIIVTGGQPDPGTWYGSENVPAMVVAMWEVEGGYWTFDNWDGDWRSDYLDPTHWMQLPKPPTT